LFAIAIKLVSKNNNVETKLKQLSEIKVVTSTHFYYGSFHRQINRRLDKLKVSFSYQRKIKLYG
jgi:hypothetical protein